MRHLEFANQTYYEHFKDSIYYSWCSFKSTWFFLIHAFLPNTFEKNGSDTIKHISDIITKKYNKIQSTSDRHGVLIVEG